MSTEVLITLCSIATLATGLITGVFLAFSDFIMKALKAASPEGGMEAMQVINRKVYGSVFLALLLGMAVSAVVIGLYAFVYVPGAASLWIFAGAGLYVVGVFVITVVCNVPMNKRLDALDVSTIDGTSYWRTYEPAWTRWNHVRTLASVGSTFCLFIGCLLLGSV